MAKVQMLVTMSGHRPNGDPWPPAGSRLDLEDWEAEHLIRGEMARPVGSTQLPAPEPEPDTPEPPVDAQESVPSGEPPTSAPRAVQPKADWVAWAMVNGLTEDQANELTKAELMEQYGARA